MPPEMLGVMPATEQPDRQFGWSMMLVPPEQDPGSLAAFEDDGTPYEICPSCERTCRTLETATTRPGRLKGRPNFADGGSARGVARTSEAGQIS
jgi:hypothetical protein